MIHTLDVPSTHFSYIDWGIVLLYLALSLFIGLKVRKYITNMTDFIGAGRAVGTWLGIATLIGTEMGLITIMYSAQKGFTGGFASFHIALLAIIVTFGVGATGFIVYRLRALKILTIPEFYEKRFGRRTRILGGILLSIGGILNMGLFLKVGAMFIVGITGLPTEGFTLAIVMSVLLAFALCYTILGGMVSVVITDYIQYVILSIGLILTVGLSISQLGLTHIFQTVSDHMGISGFDPLSTEGIFGWKYVLWMSFTAGLVSCAIWPTAVARALAAKSPEIVKKQYMLSSIGFMIRFLIPNFLGICALVFILTKSTQLSMLFFPDSTQEPLNSLYALPMYLGQLLPTGLIGIITAAMVAAFMSTHDSYLLCWSTVITQDIINPLCQNKLPVRLKLGLTRFIIFIIGLYVLYWGLFYTGTEDVWDYLAVTGAIYFTGAFALIVSGLYWKRASSTGAILALCTGFTALLGLQPVQKWVGLSAVSGEVIGLLTIGLTLSAMVFGSLLFPDKKQPTTP